jgi:hypothetical protein
MAPGCQANCGGMFGAALMAEEALIDKIKVQYQQPIAPVYYGRTTALSSMAEGTCFFCFRPQPLSSRTLLVLVPIKSLLHQPCCAPCSGSFSLLLLLLLLLLPQLLHSKALPLSRPRNSQATTTPNRPLLAEMLFAGFSTAS